MNSIGVFGTQRSKVQILSPRLDLRRFEFSIAEEIAENVRKNPYPVQRVEAMRAFQSATGVFTTRLTGGFAMKQPKPFFRKFTKTWYVQFGQRQVNLGRDKKKAWATYHVLMANQRALTCHTLTVASLFEAYLDWVSNNRAASTYEKAKSYCQSFAAHLGKRFYVSTLTPSHVSSWLAKHKQWSDTTKNDAVAVVQRPFSWAVRQKFLDISPIATVEDKPPRSRREVVYSPKQWEEILSHVKDQEFRDLLTFMWSTGCRPLEARTLEARHVDLAQGLAIFPPSESKGKKRDRMLFLPADALEICKRLVPEHPMGPIFRNRRGTPWTKDAIKCRMTRLKEKVHIPGMCAYAIRHSYATEGLKNGVDSLTLATLMGHADVSMIARTYQHLAKDIDYLRQQANRVKGQGA